MITICQRREIFHFPTWQCVALIPTIPSTYDGKSRIRLLEANKMVPVRKIPDESRPKMWSPLMHNSTNSWDWGFINQICHLPLVPNTLPPSTARPKSPPLNRIPKASNGNPEQARGRVQGLRAVKGWLRGDRRRCRLRVFLQPLRRVGHGQPIEKTRLNDVVLCHTCGGKKQFRVV